MLQEQKQSPTEQIESPVCLQHLQHQSARRSLRKQTTVKIYTELAISTKKEEAKTTVNDEISFQESIEIGSYQITVSTVCI